MRPIHRMTLMVALLAGIGSLLPPSDASAQPKKGKDEAPKEAPKEEEAGGEIEMEGGEDEAGGQIEGEIEVEGGTETTTEPSLEADTASSEAAEAEATAAAVKATDKQAYQVSWQDIVVVIRKPFLKVGRTEFLPLVGTTMNDNIIRHYSVGGQFNYYLTDVLSVGVEGHYYVKSFREPFDLVARQARRLPTVNQYNFSAALDFNYVPIYGKFAVLDKHIITWESYFTAGIGVTQSEVIPRDPRFEPFTNLLITPNLGASMRFFLFKWLTVNLGVRDYMFIDKYEPVGRSADMFPTADAARDNADSAFINNVMFQIGISFWLPTSFEYTTFR